MTVLDLEPRLEGGIARFMGALGALYNQLESTVFQHGYMQRINRTTASKRGSSRCPFTWSPYLSLRSYCFCSVA